MSDGKGGKVLVKKEKSKRKNKKGKKPVWKKGVDGYVSDPLDNDSLASTDSEQEQKVDTLKEQSGKTKINKKERGVR